MEITKQDFGRFVTERRRAGGLTQRQLAERLHVTESAVSKWERGLSYPDITLVQAIAAELGVSGQELISASEDREGRADKRDARSYRGWRSAILWTTLLSWTAAILACFIVNLSVQHTLSWFWVVLPAVGIAFCLTTLPLLPVPGPGWLALGGSTACLMALLLVVWLQFSTGSWLVIAVSAVVFALLFVFTPIWLTVLHLPGGLRRHRTLLVLVIETAALLLFLLIVFVAIGRAELWLWPALPIAAIGAAPIWVSALAIRYLPLPGLAVAALVTAFLGCCALVMDRAVAAVLGQPDEWALDLGSWNAETIETNIQFLIFLAALAVALLLGVSALARAASGPTRKAPAAV
ncbi:XRE family transcriptional regulator [Leucobacter sp. UCD-THU]|uniref:helix-turn-helix domain-containing protein n=1 Tax=Leucobacter sp. UCD-THU TaxID=1292023 RepID=UPI000368A356|nr:helix-turn-helix transcriptional regulator [Leucobacter sp. UCD-THU]EYT53817.1 XRE family transcriptional regulator [Leucobacter sp. UCD-THU]